jgi:hypothetical protein
LNTNDAYITKVLTKTAYLGLFMNVVAPIAIFIIVMLITNQGILTEGGIDFAGRPSLQIVFYVLLLVSAADLGLVYFLRRRLPAGILIGEGTGIEERFEKGVLKISVLVYVINLSHLFFGILLVFLGAAVEMMMLFVALTLIGYQLFRPRRKFLERMFQKLSNTK